MSKRTVVVIQGFGAPTATNLLIEQRLQADGYRTTSVPLPGLNTQLIETSSKMTADTVGNVLAKSGAEKVELIGVSMGGLIGLHYLRKLGGDSSVANFIALGTPFYGTPASRVLGFFRSVAPSALQMAENSDFLRDLHDHEDDHECKITSIYANGDAMVPRESARLKGADFIESKFGVWPLGHYAPIVDSRNYNIIRDVLSQA